MDPKFWHERWQQSKLGFHQPEANGDLLRHWQVLPPPGAGNRILVPLCGKSLDMIWLAEQGHAVIGVELSELAGRAFFEENRLTVEERRVGPFLSLEGSNIQLYCGDFFAMDRGLLGDVHGAYDRAALVALPPPMRELYAAHLASLLPGGATLLLITLEYPTHEMNGPPFSVDEAEVRSLFGEQFDVNRLASHDSLASEPHFAARGLTALDEVVFALRRQN